MTRRRRGEGNVVTTLLEEEVADPTLEELAASPKSGSAEVLGVVWISPSGAVRTTALSARDELVVGRGEECDIVLEGPLVSRRHARLLRNSSFWFIQDLDSRNGVRLNGAPVTRAPLVAGSVLRLGSWLGVVRPFAPSGAPTFGVLGHGLFGGPELASALKWVDIAAAADMPVVLEGETGTGKELFARAIHDRTRKDGPFLAVNCAVLQPATAAAELFGYRRGAFTGAVESYGGLVRAAHGGTLLLDELADLSLEVQAQLLRAIEQGEVIPLGESRATRVNVRFIAATQRPLAQWVAEGRFRADLQARLEGLRIELPPLRRRTGDVPLLFLNLLSAYSPCPPQPEVPALEWLALREWPLNVRELVALARRTLAAYPQASHLSLEQLTALVTDPQARPPTEGIDSSRPPRRPRVDGRAFRPETVASLRAALERNSGSVAKAAAELEISRQRAYRILRHSAKPPSVG
jgi:transcriptional regulator of acetoin/glycerol metabolism